MVFAPDGRSLWVASPRPGDCCRTVGPSPVRPGVGPPDPAADPERRAGHRLAVTPDGRYLVGAVWGLHPEDGVAWRTRSRTQRWRTASIVVWEAATGRVVRKVEVNAERDLATANSGPTRT